jgi:hypothetical protein
MQRYITKTTSRIIFLLLMVGSSYTFAWLYPEHRDIAVLAIQNLDPRYRALLDQLWKEARKGYESRLSESVIDTTLDFIDYASWPAIAGDHSCSSENMLNNVLKTDWILEVSAIAAELKADLAAADNRSRHINAVRDSDIKFQKADPEYATRAGSNNVHFLLARPDVNTDTRSYSKLALSEGSELNAIGAYAWFHISAMEKASLLVKKNLTKEQRSMIALSALADEAFALHFIQDVFASGHVAGTWGDASQRKGTHDYYNENGIEVSTWDGNRLILMGDAYMRPQDATIAAETIRKSLVQVLEAAAGINTVDNKQPNVWQPDDFNVCKASAWPKKDFDENMRPLLREVLITTPVPGMASGKGSLPRFRSELGTFIGIVPAVRGIGYSQGFEPEMNNPGVITGIEVALRIGMGIEGVLNQSGDGLVFLDVGVRQDGNSIQNANYSPDLEWTESFRSAIPSRGAYFVRARMPFWLIPLDLLITAPVLLIADPDAYARMAVQAANGGLIYWQSGIATPIGRFQFILGREVGITFYGYTRNKDVIIIPTENDVKALLQYQSTQFNFPIVEYRPFRTFSKDQSSSMMVQFSFGFDYPHSQNMIYPEDENTPELSTLWYLGVNIAFDWRYYW